MKMLCADERGRQLVRQGKEAREGAAAQVELAHVAKVPVEDFDVAACNRAEVSQTRSKRGARTRTHRWMTSSVMSSLSCAPMPQTKKRLA